MTLLEGPALAAAAVAAAAVAPGIPGRQRLALAAAGAGAGAFGCYDDLAGRADRRGFRGHLGALTRGELTSGAIKVGGIGCAAAIAAGALGGKPGDRAVNTALIAGGANLVNLFDLRPGRAVKVAVAAGALAGGSGPAARRGVAAPLGAALALLPDDLGERAMLGDAGANALGAMLAAAVAANAPRPARVAALGVVVALTAASERVSFSRVIDSVPALRMLDLLGRPAARQGSSGQQSRAASVSGAAPGGERSSPGAPASRRPAPVDQAAGEDAHAAGPAGQPAGAADRPADGAGQCDGRARGSLPSGDGVEPAGSAGQAAGPGNPRAPGAGGAAPDGGRGAGRPAL